MEALTSVEKYSYNIPKRTKDAIQRYVEKRIPPGGFVYAVLENKLFEALSSADDENLASLRDILSYLYNEVPLVCWGSPAKVKNWLSGTEQ